MSDLVVQGTIDGLNYRVRTWRIHNRDLYSAEAWVTHHRHMVAYQVGRATSVSRTSAAHLAINEAYKILAALDKPPQHEIDHADRLIDAAERAAIRASIVRATA